MNKSFIQSESKKSRLYKIKPFLFVFIAFLMLHSCVPLKKTKYVQKQEGVENQNSYTTQTASTRKIRPEDNLYIKVLSFDEKTYSFFNVDSRVTGGTNSDVTINLYSYVVDLNGFISFPFVGELQVQNLTLAEAKKKIEEALQDYLDQVSVVIKFVNTTITLLGEVNLPGEYRISKEQVNIFQALGLASDMTEFADRKDVTIIREINGQTTYNYIDITDKAVVTSEFYYIQPNDVVYIPPLKEKKWGFKTFPYATVLSAITTIVTVLYYFERT